MIKGHGLVTGHLYTVLGVVDLSSAGGPKLLKLRNPWGSETYKGPWRDDDPQWTDEFKKMAKLVVADDGIFHMTVDTYVTHFTSMEVCQYSDDWKTTKLDVTGTGQFFEKRMKSATDQEVIVS